MSAPEAPDVRLDPAALADLELALLGVLPQGHVLGNPFPYGSPGVATPGNRTVGVSLPPPLAEAAQVAGRAVLRDDEGTPLAELTGLDVHPEADATAAPSGDPGGTRVVLGSIVPLRARESGEGGRLALSAADLSPGGRPAQPPSLLVLGRPVVEQDAAGLAALSGGGTELLVAVPTAGGPQAVPTSVLLRAARDLVRDLTRDPLPDTVPHKRSAQLRTVPLAWRDPRSDTALVQSLASAVGADRTLFLRADGDDPGARQWQQVRRDLESGGPERLHGVTEVTETLLRRWKPLRGRRGLVLMFTGFSGSGKSTLARDVSAQVLQRTARTLTLLDGDVVRTMLSSGLGFDRASRILNVRRIGYVAAEVARHGGMAVCAPIAPYASTRADVRTMVEQVGDFVLVHVSTPLAECERRDLKGLYARARAGLIPEFTGISDPYDVPVDADLSVDTSALSRDDACALVLEHLRSGSWLELEDR